VPDSCAREIQLLLACSRTTVDAARALRVRELVQQGVNWDDVLASAEAHDTRPLLARSLASTMPDDIPAHVTASLRRWVQANRLRSMRLTAELARLSRALQRAGVAALPLKGPLLAEMAYGDVTLRYSIDLDLLVRRQNLERALAVLADSGSALGGMQAARAGVSPRAQPPDNGQRAGSDGGSSLAAGAAPLRHASRFR